MRLALVAAILVAIVLAAGVGYIAPHPTTKQTGYEFPIKSFNSCIANVRTWFPKMRTNATPEERALILLSQNAQCLESNGADYIGLVDVYRLTG